MHELIPNAIQLEKSLKDFADVIEASEILLFEKTTFLVVSHCLKKDHDDLQRFEKISNIIKQFKLSCRLEKINYYYFYLTSIKSFILSKFDTSFQSIEIKNSNYTIIIDLFTPNTYIMVIISDPRISKKKKVIKLIDF